MRYTPRELFVANTDRAWFDYLSSRAVDGRLDEVNFWAPSATRPMRAMKPGEPVFFRLKRPDYAVAGYGLFAHFDVVDLDGAWLAFGWKNGDPHKRSFFTRIGGYRGVDLLDPAVLRQPLGCTVLREARFWPRSRWLPWGVAEGWQPNIVQGRTERDAARVAILAAAMREDEVELPDDLRAGFTPLDVDERALSVREVVDREGQGAFRLRLLHAYGRSCAITGEHTEPVLDAAHIQPYLGARSNHVQNGLLLTKEFHVLFDQGYVTITPDYVVRVSERLRSEWKNGRRYYPYDGQALHVPADAELRPSRDALAWHGERVFRRSA